MNPDEIPFGANVFAAALQWLEGTLLGTVATTVAVIAVASVGVLLLSGRIDVRRAGQVIFGCFILFGASTIATGILQAVNGTGEPAQSEAAPPAPPPVEVPPPIAKAPVKAVPYDPYAGAALPTRS